MAGDPRMELAARAARWIADGRAADGLRLAVVASLAPEEGVRELLALADDELATVARVRIAALEPRPRWLPPPKGWGVLKEVVERVGWERSALASRIAHFHPLSLARVARAAWDLWGDSDRTGKVWRFLVQEAPGLAKRERLDRFFPELYVGERR